MSGPCPEKTSIKVIFENLKSLGTICFDKIFCTRWQSQMGRYELILAVSRYEK